MWVNIAPGSTRKSGTCPCSRASLHVKTRAAASALHAAGGFVCDDSRRPASGGAARRRLSNVAVGSRRGCCDPTLCLWRPASRRQSGMGVANARRLLLPRGQAADDPPRSAQLFVKPDDRWEVNDVRHHHVEWSEALEKTLCDFAAAIQQPGSLAVPPLPSESAVAGAVEASAAHYALHGDSLWR